MKTFGIEIESNDVITISFKKKIDVLISVPHSFCDCLSKKDLERHYCDPASKPFANYIYDEIKKNGMNVTAFYPNTSRKEIDMNRRESRETVYRKLLDNAISELDDNSVLLDIHSAPHDTFENPFEIYILQLYSNPKDDDFNFALCNFLREKKVTCFLLDGTDANDIIYRAMHDFKLKNVVLIEISENLPDERISEIAEFIADFIKDYLC